MSESRRQITQLLRSWRGGDQAALSALAERVYGELRKLAASRLRSESAGHTLQPTELVHEAFLRLVDAPIDWQDRVHFFAVVASTMRRVLVDHARAKGRQKRGSNPLRVTLNANDVQADAPEVDLLDLDQTLHELERLDAKQARLVEMYYFTGLTLEEISETTGIPRSTTHRMLRSARAWIHHRLRIAGANPDAD